LTIPSNVNIGDTITANDGSSGRPNLPTILTTLDTNRLNFAVSQMGTTSVLNNTRTTSWTVSVMHEFVVIFSTENSARYFFNSGGSIYVSASRTGGSSSSINSTISQLLTDMGTIKFGAKQTTYTGIGGVPTSTGYYELTSSYQTVFTHFGTTNGYTSASYKLKAKAENISGVNGANGLLVRFQATFESGLIPYYSVDGTLTSSVSELKAGGVLTITSPTYLTSGSL
jgi:hypothetical protein